MTDDTITVVPPVQEEPIVEELKLTPQVIKGYIEAIGRRKAATARVRIMNAGKTSITINEKDVKDYFSTDTLREAVQDPFTKVKLPEKFKVTARVTGGGIRAQAESVRHGISRIILKLYPELRKQLKDLGFLKRDPRVKERRKFGLKKARKAPQWSKR